MDEYEQKIYSCYCLFDDCCLSKAKNETIKQLAERIQFSMKKKYQQMIKSGLCSCIHCKPLKFLSKGIWILREISHEFQTDIKYVTCREFYSKKLKNMFIGEIMNLK